MFKSEPGMESQSPSTQPSQSASQFNPAEASRSDVDEILRRKRKAREYKACYPCRQRKVKCDQAVPCKTCIGMHSALASPAQARRLVADLSCSERASRALHLPSAC